MYLESTIPQYCCTEVCILCLEIEYDSDKCVKCDLQAAMAISMKDLQSVHLKKTESSSSGGGQRGQKAEKVKNDPFKQMLQKSQKGEEWSLICLVVSC